jgi:protein-tyrosine phosphatase
VIDLHSHILPGLDDGVTTFQQSLSLAREAAAGGIVAIAATPHVRDDFPTTADAMERALAQVRARLEEADVDVRVLPGGEIALDWLDRLPRDELQRFGLGGNANYLLVETPYYGLPLTLEDSLFRLRADGITPVLAHPERNGEVQADLGRIARLVDTGVLVQVTADSLDGRAGKRARSAARRLLSSGLAHLVASDAHAPTVRRGGLDGVAREVGDADLARWLTTDVPTAIVAGRPLPARPRRTRFIRFRGV